MPGFAARKTERQWLVAEGDVCDHIRIRDWSRSAVGALRSWPQTLRFALNLCLGSTAPSAVVWGDQRTLLYNDAYRSFLGEYHPIALGRSFDDCTPFAPMGIALRRALAGETTTGEEQACFRRRKGRREEVFLTHTFVPIRDESNDVVGAFHQVTDTTVRALELRRLRALAERVDARDESERAKAAFFVEFAGEFRTPLNLMLGPIEDELEEADQPLSPVRHARLGVAQKNGLHLRRMLEALLDVAQIDDGSLQPSFEPVDLAAYTEELVSSFRKPIEEAGLLLSTRIEALHAPVYVDREMWGKVVLNLLSNALKYTFKGGITVSLFQSDESRDHVELRVDDSGIGIPSRELPLLFQRFYRVKGACGRDDQGTGIGLAHVEALTTLHGGEVSAVSRVGLGSSFRVRLRRGFEHLARDSVVAPRSRAYDNAPLADCLAEALRWSNEASGPHASQEALEPPPSSEPGSMPRARVLWADSNTDMRNYVARLLGRSYEVEAVSDGAVLLRAANERPPDIILFDLMLAGRDGLELLRELRAGARTSLIPVILISARAGEDAALEGLDAGADDYLVKPLSRKTLLARVRSRLTLAKLRLKSADELLEANKELEAFSYSVSHDLRAPLRAIDGFSKALLSEHNDQLDEQGRHYLERVRAGTARMAQLIDDILGLSRLTRAPMSREFIDLTATCQEILADLASREPGRRVKIDVAEGLIGLGDSRLVGVLLDNLLDNAWKFTAKQPEPQIEVGCEQRDGEVVFLVRDNGAGFKMEYASKLFAPFQRLHSGADFQGTGIGLATAHRVVTRHGGRIWAEGEPNRGATFFFTLGELA